ncbi:ferric reductase-like transmembrane domain-containing protein [uncultured Clostridium sp.]|uniref:ferric reductase-like transmembrane domain-containing protein n=1 Tax=uncultured Clostridium sp. TaxID=59620 RepID=UPI0026031B03|nr:ferric reductase-like transmembrane domain-containing protein [uncultured Clostridium sp.]
MKILYDLIIPISAITVFSILLAKNIKKHAKLYYLGALSIASASTIYEFLKLFKGIQLTGTFAILERMSLKGFLSLAFFLLVMFCGALNLKWNITKRLISIRGELSILGCILMLPHLVIYSTRFIMRFFAKSPMTYNTYIYTAFGFIAFLIMIPLFITSFKSIRKKMSYPKWKSIQRYSYLFFLLIYLHIAVILINAKEFNLTKFLIYTAIFLSYSVLKLNKVNSIQKANQKQTFSNKTAPNLS